MNDCSANACSCHHIFCLLFRGTNGFAWKKETKPTVEKLENWTGAIRNFFERNRTKNRVALLYIEIGMQMRDGSDGSRAFSPPDSIVNSVLFLRTRMRLRKSRSFTGLVFLFFMHSFIHSFMLCEWMIDECEWCCSITCFPTRSFSLCNAVCMTIVHCLLFGIIFSSINKTN